MRLQVANARGAPTLGITLLLASLSMISPLSIDTFLPSLPTIARDFNITSWQAQQLITAYLAPFAVFSLVHGSLSDALGRRTVVIGGLALYTVGSIGCFLAPNLGLLLFCRVLQGMAAGVGSTVTRAVVRDMFDGANAQKLMSRMMFVFSLAPAAAPIIGGWLHVTLGWRAVFGLLLAIGATQLVVCSLLLPETHPPSKRIKFHPLTLLRSCWQVAGDRAFMLLAFAAALSIAPLFAYIGSTPSIILDVWKLKETQFHIVFVPVVLGFMVASLVGSHMAGRVTRPRQIAIGFGLLFLSGGGELLAHGFADQHAPILFTQLMLFSLALGVQLSNPVLSLQMLDMHPLGRGAAASVAAFIVLGVGAVTMGMIAPVLQGDLRLLAWISLAAYSLAWMAWRGGQALNKGRSSS